MKLHQLLFFILLSCLFAQRSSSNTLKQTFTHLSKKDIGITCAFAGASHVLFTKFAKKPKLGMFSSVVCGVVGAGISSWNAYQKALQAEETAKQQEIKKKITKTKAVEPEVKADEHPVVVYKKPDLIEEEEKKHEAARVSLAELLKKREILPSQYAIIKKFMDDEIGILHLRGMNQSLKLKIIQAIAHELHIPLVYNDRDRAIGIAVRQETRVLLFNDALQDAPNRAFMFFPDTRELKDSERFIFCCNMTDADSRPPEKVAADYSPQEYEKKYQGPVESYQLTRDEARKRYGNGRNHFVEIPLEQINNKEYWEEHVGKCLLAGELCGDGAILIFIDEQTNNIPSHILIMLDTIMKHYSEWEYMGNILKRLIMVYDFFIPQKQNQDKTFNVPPQQPNPYVELGVASNATREEIRTAFRKLAMQWHPDKNKTSAAEEMFKRIQHAYETLIDPDKRAKYDALNKQ